MDLLYKQMDTMNQSRSTFKKALNKQNKRKAYKKGVAFSLSLR